jgi:hypothetical protein
MAPSRTSAADTIPRPTASATAAETAATAGSSHHTSSGPVSLGSDEYCHHPTPVAANPATSSAQAMRRRLITASSTRAPPAPAPT